MQLGNHIQVVDNAIKEVENSNTQLVSNMEQVSNIVDTITTCITHSSRTSERMLSKYQETADNINTIEDVMENMMCDLGIGGFMGIEDIKPGMKIDLQLVGQEDVQYLGELIEQLPENQRQVIRLRGIEDCSYEDIEQITGLSSSNIRTLLSRARKLIREKLEKASCHG